MSMSNFSAKENTNVEGRYKQKRDSGTGVGEFYEISKNIFFYRTPMVAASAKNRLAYNG